MTVWCVMEYDVEGAYLHSIWATETAAEEHAEELNRANKERGAGTGGWSWGVEAHQIRGLD